MRIHQLITTALLPALLATVVGCGGDSGAPGPDDRPPLDTPEGDEGFSLKVPGIVDVETDEDGGVRVKTPAGDVDSGPEGTRIETLGTDIDIRPAPEKP